MNQDAGDFNYYYWLREALKYKIKLQLTKGQILLFISLLREKDTKNRVIDLKILVY